MYSFRQCVRGPVSKWGLSPENIFLVTFKLKILPSSLHILWSLLIKFFQDLNRVVIKHLIEPFFLKVHFSSSSQIAQIASQIATSEATCKDSSLSLKKGSRREVEGKLPRLPGSCPSGLISSFLPNITSTTLFNDNELSCSSQTIEKECTWWLVMPNQLKF